MEQATVLSNSQEKLNLFDILEEIQKKLPGFPIVLHGASAVDPVAVETCNKYGGNIAELKVFS